MRHQLWICAALLACGKAPPVSVASSNAPIALDPPSAEVWSSEVALRGQAREAKLAAKLARCELLVDAADPGAPTVFPASLEGGLLSGRVRVPPQVVTHARARCVDIAGKSYESAPSVLTSRVSAGPVARIEAKLHGGHLLLDARASRANADTGAALTEYRWFVSTMDGSARTSLGTGSQLDLAIPKARGEVHYELVLRDAAGREARARTAVQYTGQTGRVADAQGATWLEGAVVYGVVPKLHGTPSFAKLGDKLDDLHALGINTLWLAPVFKTADGGFGDAITDYFAVRSDYGDQAAFDALLQRAHGHGMRVLLDLAVDHSSSEHPYYRDSEANGVRSHYYSFYDRDKNGKATHPYDAPGLPNFHFGDPELEDWVLAFSQHWLARGVDGFRVDTAWGPKQRQPSFYPAWSSAVRAVSANVLLVAEASARDPYYLQNGFDAAYDWNEQLGHHAWAEVFASEHGIAQRLAEQLTLESSKTARPDRVFRFLNSDESGARFITRHGESLTRVATAALLTLPGIPSLYDFDEVGGEYDPRSGQAPAHTDRPSLREFHKQLIALRKNWPALHGAGFRLLKVGPDSELLAYLRVGSEANELAVVLLNFGSAPVQAKVALPSELQRWFGRGLSDALTGKKLGLVRGQIPVSLAAWDVMVLAPVR